MAAIVSIFTTLLLELYKISGSLGLAIVLFTLIVRSLLWPLTLPSLKAQKKIKELQPELKKLKAKHGTNKQALQQAQMELYKKYNVNPLAGCIPQLVQIGFLYMLYHALNTFLKQSMVNGMTIDPTFFWMNLSKPDHSFVLPVLAGLSQLVLSLMIAPATEVPDSVPNQSKSPKVQKENKKEEDVAEMAATMQSQMIFMMPIIIGVSAFSFPSGLALYWTVTTIFSVVQQYFVSGPGGLVSYSQRAWYYVKKVTNRAGR